MLWNPYVTQTVSLVYLGDVLFLVNFYCIFDLRQINFLLRIYFLQTLLKLNFFLWRDHTKSLEQFFSVGFWYTQPATTLNQSSGWKLVYIYIYIYIFVHILYSFRQRFFRNTFECDDLVASIYIFFRNSCKARFVSSSGSDGKTGNKNVLKSDVVRFISHVWTCLATNSIGSCSSVNTDSWLDKITRESRHTRQLSHFLQNKLTWNYSLPSVIAFPNLQPVADPGEGSGGPGPPLSKGLDDRLPPLSKGLDAALATTWFVARQVWMWVVKRRNVA